MTLAEITEPPPGSTRQTISTETRILRRDYETRDPQRVNPAYFSDLIEALDSNWKLRTEDLPRRGWINPKLGSVSARIKDTSIYCSLSYRGWEHLECCLRANGDAGGDDGEYGALDNGSLEEGSVLYQIDRFLAEKIGKREERGRR